MTETSEASEQAPKKRAGGLNGMLLADLKAMAAGMSIAGAGTMKKAQLVEAIKAAQAGAGPATPARKTAARKPDASPSETPEATQDRAPGRQPQTSPDPGSEPSDQAPRRREPQAEQRPARGDEGGRDVQGDDGQDAPRDDRGPAKAQKAGKADKTGKAGKADKGGDKGDRGEKPENAERADRSEQRSEPDPGSSGQGSQDGQQDGDGEGRTGRNRRRRGRDRSRAGQPGTAPQQGGGQQGGGQQPSGQQGSQQGGQQGGGQGGQGGGQGNRHEPDTTILEDDIVVPAAGILDVLDNYAFVRTSGYLPGPDDVYLSLSMVRRFGLRRGDAIVGQVRHPREGERREKFNPMVRIDSVNGQDPDTARTRADFAKLTPLFPSERLRLETGSANVVGRVIDLAAPIGKGQRGLVVAPRDAGKTMLLQSIAASISTNNPECHLMVVLVDERPEEVTDFERSVKGEVIASTFDRPATDHTTLAELAIERAKRLVELGHDVVVLLDGLTRLGRAYQHSVTSSGRTLPGGVDAAALHPPKRFFGAARNVESGGSLTILATVLVETGSATDEAIYEELQGTDNLRIRLRSELAADRLVPAVDPLASSTRHEDRLLGEQEAALVWQLRRSLATGPGEQPLGRLLERVGRTHSNIELLTQLQQSTRQEK